MRPTPRRDGLCLPQILTLVAVVALIVVVWLQKAGTRDADRIGVPEHELVRRYLSYDDPAIALVGVRVIDGTGVRTKANQTVLIEQGVISEVGPAESIAIQAA